MSRPAAGVPGARARRQGASERRAGGGSRPPTRRAALLVVLAATLVPVGLHASEAAHGVPPELLWIPLVLLVAKLANLVERVGQPPVLGELIAGVLLGNLTLLGVDAFAALPEDPVMVFLAEFGVVLLLFQIGLESSVDRMRRVGGRAAAVAVIGVVVPMLLAVLLAPPLLPGLSRNAYLFIGAALTATSVGITARVFRDLGALSWVEAQIVLGAAVIDDVLGLVLLAILSALATAGTVSAGAVAWIVAKAVLFLAGATFLGQAVAAPIGRLLSRIQRGASMKLTLLLAFALVFAWLAGVIGLAPIVGAFAAGLVLMPTHFRDFDEPALLREIRRDSRDFGPREREIILEFADRHADRHVEDLIDPLVHVFVPIFFVLTGMAVDLRVFADPGVVAVALLLTVIAVVGKLVAGLGAGPVRRSIVGWGMVPRGEVGLIFATIGRATGVVGDHVYSVIVLIVILTTLLTPPVLALVLRRAADRASPSAVGPAGG